MKIHHEELSDVTRYLDMHSRISLDEQRPHFERIVTAVSRFKPIDEKTEILEIGTGSGWFPILSKMRGWRCKGLEISPQLIEYANKWGAQYGVVPDVELGNLEDYELGRNRYDVIIASNTSSISITRLASVTGRPERFIGIHFMNPVPRMQLVELIRGIATDDATFEDAKGFIAKLGKTVSVSEDFPAFIVNRILLPMINEAVYTLYEGVGSVEAIDTAMKLGANHPMGPLQLADFIGLDTCLSVMQVLHEGLADSKYRPCPLLVKYVEAGWLGKKTQRGFYDYRSGTPVPTR